MFSFGILAIRYRWISLNGPWGWSKLSWKMIGIKSIQVSSWDYRKCLISFLKHYKCWLYFGNTVEKNPLAYLPSFEVVKSVISGPLKKVPNVQINFILSYYVSKKKKLILTLKQNDLYLISRTSIHVLIKRIMIDQYASHSH